MAAPFELGELRVDPGMRGNTELPVSRLPTGAWIALPVTVVHGSCPGPTLWLSATMHGDELNGVPIIRRILKRIDAARLCGTVVAMPIVNIFGLLQGSRYLPDRRDLNRCFPGSKRGSAASQLAHLVMTEVVARCDVGIDLHTGSGGRTNWPQIRANLDDPETAALAQAFHAPLTLHASVRPGSLRGSASARGKRVLVYEAGEAHRFHAEAIRTGVAGILRVMGHLGMLEDVPEPPPQSILVSRKSTWVRARRAGFCELDVRLGKRVHKGQRLGVVFDALSSESSPVTAKAGGVVIGRLTKPLVHRGDALVNIAVLDDEAD